LHVRITRFDGLYCLGKDSNDVLISTNVTDEERQKFDDVLAKFDVFLNFLFWAAFFQQVMISQVVKRGGGWQMSSI